MKDLYFRCIKSLADEDNIIIMRNDIVQLVEQDDDGKGILVMGKYGWSEGHELSFDNKQVAEYFEIIHQYFPNNSPHDDFSNASFNMFSA